MKANLDYKICTLVNEETYNLINEIAERTGYSLNMVIRYYLVKGLEHEKNLPMPELSQSDTLKHTRAGETRIL